MFGVALFINTFFSSHSEQIFQKGANIEVTADFFIFTMNKKNITKHPENGQECSFKYSTYAYFEIVLS